MRDRLLLILKEGGVALIPTDTIPGIMTVYNNIRGLDRIFRLKKRDKKLTIAVLIGSREQLKYLVREVPEYADKLMRRFWPGALTVVLPPIKGLPKQIVSLDGVAIRMPAYKPLQKLINTLDMPLAATSINVHTKPPITELSNVPNRFAKGVDYISRAKFRALDTPSTVVKFADGKPIVVRQGAIKVKPYHMPSRSSNLAINLS